MARLTIVNPSERHWGARRYVLSFGAVGMTHLMVWGRSLDDALETAAEWLADNAPGLIMPAWGEEHTGLVKESCEERGLAWPMPDDADPEADGYYDAQQDAESDLTYTESGYLTSYEWFITLDEHATREDVKAFIRELDERNYGSEPTVAVARS